MHVFLPSAVFLPFALFFGVIAWKAHGFYRDANVRSMSMGDGYSRIETERAAQGLLNKSRFAVGCCFLCIVCACFFTLLLR